MPIDYGLLFIFGQFVAEFSLYHDLNQSFQKS